MLELVPVQKPLPCYSLEYNKADPRCQSCPHQPGCVQHSGLRANKVTLDKLKFQFVPKAFAQAYDFDMEDPELPHIQRNYFKCFEVIFGKPPVDDMSRFAQEVLAGARKSNCSIQMYMLSVMVGHREAQKVRMEKLGLALPRPFSAKKLTGPVALKHAKMYAEMCSNEFGTFSLSSLSSLVNEDFTSTVLENKMLHSEAVVGKFIVGYKIQHGGPPWATLFDTNELTLDPYWLAIDETYTREIFMPYQDDKRGSEAIKQHRFSVGQVMGHLKKHSSAAINAFRAREAVMPRAVSEVLTYYGFRPDDFNIDPEPITDPMEFWVYLGRAFQHFHCLLHLEGMPSLLNRR